MRPCVNADRSCGYERTTLYVYVGAGIGATPRRAGMKPMDAISKAAASGRTISTTSFCHELKVTLAWMRTHSFLLGLLVACGLATAGGRTQATSNGPRVEISFAASVRQQPVTGMVYLAISRDNRQSPIEQVSPTGVPLFSHYVENLAPGAVVGLGAADRG